MSQEERVNQLRQLLSAVPDLHIWNQLWAKVNEWPFDDDISIEWDYLTHHLDQWPDHLRLLPSDKREAWIKGERDPMFPLVRGAEIAQGYMLTGWEAMASPYAHQLTHLQLKRLTPTSYDVDQQLGRTDLQLKSLFWSDSQPNAKQLAAFLQAPALQSLRHLALQHDALRQEECRTIATHAPKTLEQLNLNHNQIHAASAYILFDSERLAQVTTLSLRWNQLTNKRFCPLTPAMQSLQHLDLAHNQLGGRALERLLQTPCCHSLKTLDISGNVFDTKGISAFAELLPPTLRSLHMRCTDLNDNDARQLADALPCHALQTLDLSYNSIHPNTLQDLQTHAPLTLTSILCEPYNVQLPENIPTSNTTTPLVLLAGADTQSGPVRGHNEDACGISHEKTIYVVADGMGGQSSGSIASQALVRALTTQAKANLTSEFPTILPPDAPGISLEICDYLARSNQHFQQTTCFLYDRLQRANALIHDPSPAIAGRSMSLRGMGCAFACIAFLPQRDYALLSHAGSDRIYRWRDNTLTQLTQDHSLLNEYLKLHTMTPEEITQFPYRNVITKALGITDELEPDYALIPVQPKDLFLLCSDGIHQTLEHTQLEAFFHRRTASLDAPSTPTLTGTCEALLQEAIRHECKDNLTAMLVWAGHPHPTA